MTQMHLTVLDRYNFLLVANDAQAQMFEISCNNHKFFSYFTANKLFDYLCITKRHTLIM